MALTLKGVVTSNYCKSTKPLFLSLIPTWAQHGHTQLHTHHKLAPTTHPSLCGQGEINLFRKHIYINFCPDRKWRMSRLALMGQCHCQIVEESCCGMGCSFIIYLSRVTLSFCPWWCSLWDIIFPTCFGFLTDKSQPVTVRFESLIWTGTESEKSESESEPGVAWFRTERDGPWPIYFQLVMFRIGSCGSQLFFFGSRPYQGLNLA